MRFHLTAIAMLSALALAEPIPQMDDSDTATGTYDEGPTAPSGGAMASPSGGAQYSVTNIVDLPKSDKMFRFNVMPGSVECLGQFTRLDPLTRAEGYCKGDGYYFRISKRAGRGNTAYLKLLKDKKGSGLSTQTTTFEVKIKKSVEKTTDLVGQTLAFQKSKDKTISLRGDKNGYADLQKKLQEAETNSGVTNKLMGAFGSR